MRRIQFGHSCHRWDEFKINEKDRLETFDFERCPYCGDPLDLGHTSVIKVELDSLHYGEKRLVKFIAQLQQDYKVKLLDVFTSVSMYILLVQVQGDGDKVAIHLQNYPEVKMAYDKRHERISLN